MKGKIGLAGMLAVAACCFMMSGCAMFNRTTIENVDNTTIGEQLIDLKNARDKGAITEQEYNDLRERIKASKSFSVKSN